MLSAFSMRRSVNMALFSKKEIEALQCENDSLKEKIISLETRLSAKDKLILEYKTMIDEFEQQTERLNSEVKKYKCTAADTFSSHQVKKLHQQYNDYISELEEKIYSSQTHPHNERGAGRKYKATSEQRDYIVSLFSQGISQNKIARMMTEQTGGKWNKTTIRNIIISAKN